MSVSVQALELTTVCIEQDVEVPKAHLSLSGFKIQDSLAAQCMTDKCVNGSCHNGFVECCWRKRPALPVLQNVHILQSSVHNWGIHSIRLLTNNALLIMHTNKQLCKCPPGS